MDDETALTRVVGKILQQLNYRVTALHRAREAIDLCRADPQRFDLVIVDLAMPELSGIELTRELLALRSDLPIILATGYSGSHTEESLQQLGIRALLQKPFTPEAIGQTVHRVLAGKA